MNANVDLTGVVLETDRLIIREWNGDEYISLYYVLDNPLKMN